MNQNELSQSLMKELYSLLEEKIREVKDFILFLKYKANSDFYSKKSSEPLYFNPRVGWNELFQSMGEQGDDLLLDEDLSGQTKWDKEEWEWK
jgi:hypothetical protein